MRTRVSIAVLIVLVFLAGLTGCGSRESKGPGSSSTTRSVPTEVRHYEAKFDDATVELDIPANSKRAEDMRLLMSQSPPYLIAEMKLENRGQATIRYSDFKPVLLYSGGERYEGASRTEFETDRIAPGETLTGLYQFAKSDFGSLEKVLIERAGGQPSEAVLVESDD